MIAKVKKEIGKAKMKAEVEIGRAANVRWIMENRSDLTENFPNRWVAVDVSGPDGPSVQLVDIELFQLFKIMSMRETPSSSVYYLCNDFIPPVILGTPPEVWNVPI